MSAEKFGFNPDDILTLTTGQGSTRYRRDAALEMWIPLLGGEPIPFGETLFDIEPDAATAPQLQG